jgi:hypothetical protein
VGLLSGGWKWQGGLGLPLPKPVTPLVTPIRLALARSNDRPGSWRVPFYRANPEPIPS